jgi:hypothetical protein
MVRYSEDSISVYSRPSLQGNTSTTLTSPSSAEVILGRTSIEARRLSPPSALYGTSGAWSLLNERDHSEEHYRRSNLIPRPRIVGSSPSLSSHWTHLQQQQQPPIKEEETSDAEMFSKLFTNVNSNDIHLTFPSLHRLDLDQDQKALPLHPSKSEKDDQTTVQREEYLHTQHSHYLNPPRPARVSKVSFSRKVLLAGEEKGGCATPPRKKRADLQSKFSMSPDSHTASARNAKAIKKKASQGRLRKNSFARDQLGLASAVAEQSKPRIKPQSSMSGLKKFV